MIDGQSSQRYVPAAPPSGLAFTACQVQHARATVELTRHPCQLAAHFLPCARPPDRQFGRSRNNVAPEQVLFDAGCADYADERAHIAIAHAAENLLREGYESTDDDDDA